MGQHTNWNEVAKLSDADRVLMFLAHVNGEVKIECLAESMGVVTGWDEQRCVEAICECERRGDIKEVTP